MRRARLAAMALAAIAPAGFAPVGLAQAQSASEYRLPPANAASSPAPQGPVDEPQSIRASRPAPTPAPDASTALPALHLPPPPPTLAPDATTEGAVAPMAAPHRRGEPSRRHAAPGPQYPGAQYSGGTPAPVATPQSAAPTSAPLAPSASTVPLEPSAPAADVPSAAPVVAAIPAASAEADAGLPWLPLAALALVGLGAIVGVRLLLRGRRKAETLPEEWSEPVVPSSPEPVRPQFASGAAGSAPVAAPPPPRREGRRSLGVAFAAEQLGLSLVYATLRYRLTLRNDTGRPAGPVRVVADMISAHASQAPEAQLGPDPEQLTPVHALRELAPGEIVTLEGELRLPLAAILPIGSATGPLFVPLVQLGVIHEGGTELRVLAVGQAGDTPGAALRPFVLDAGPRTIRDLDGRIAASEHLDPMPGPRYAKASNG